MAKPQRIRDPVHDLIEFSSDPFEQAMWGLLDTPEFQRLRRIRQLGFSEQVFPGATHSRFAHSVGVFNTARQLVQLISRHCNRDTQRAQQAMCAALVHDVGHGPFSHAFEEAAKALGASKDHEDWTAEILLGETKLGKKLQALGDDFRREVADLLASEVPADIYASIVSSQFDADRLDYVRRDRLMTGTEQGGFDLSWLLANLEVDRVAYARDGETFAEADALVLSSKALQAAEAYVLGLFQLYFTVYFHKTTRAAERMLTALLVRVGELIQDRGMTRTGLTKGAHLVAFLKKPAISSYLQLDDFHMWTMMQYMADAEDEVVRELANRLRSRNLYKSIDIQARLAPVTGAAGVARFRAKLSQARQSGAFGPHDVLDDDPARTPYKRRGFDSPEALNKVLIRGADGNGTHDLADRSEVVRTLEQRSIFRVCVRDENANEIVEDILKEVSR